MCKLGQISRKESIVALTSKIKEHAIQILDIQKRVTNYSNDIS